MKNFESMALHELFLKKAHLATIDNGYQELNLETPEDIILDLSSVIKEIDERVRGEMERKLRTTEARLDALKTPDEKRKELLALAEDLRKRLGKGGD